MKVIYSEQPMRKYVKHFVLASAGKQNCWSEALQDMPEIQPI